jgi:RNA polymerase sigma factor (sigma-70 family)
VGGRASQGLDAEFVAFVDRSGGRYLRVAVLLTGDWHAAEDLLQTCLVKLYRVWPRLDLTTDLDAYLRRMLINAQLSWWRARWRREVPVAAIPDRAGEADGQDRHARAADVRQALQALPARQRAVLVLRFFETCR